MKIYITGISGFLSINLVRHLLAKGYDDIAGIDLVDFDYPERDRINFKQGDIRSIQDLRESMKGADVVVHTAAALPLYTPEEIYSTDIEGTRNVIERAKEILADLEQDRHGEAEHHFSPPRASGKGRAPSKKAATSSSQLSLFSERPHPVVQKLKNLDVNSLTPLEALNKLAELIKKARRDRPSGLSG